MSLLVGSCQAGREKAVPHRVGTVTTSLSTLAHIASAATNLIFVVVIAIGYFMMIRLYRQMVAVYDRILDLMEARSTSLGRPLVVVYEDP